MDTVTTASSYNCTVCIKVVCRQMQLSGRALYTIIDLSFSKCFR